MTSDGTNLTRLLWNLANPKTRLRVFLIIVAVFVSALADLISIVLISIGSQDIGNPRTIGGDHDLQLFGADDVIRTYFPIVLPTFVLTAYFLRLYCFTAINLLSHNIATSAAKHLMKNYLYLPFVRSSEKPSHILLGDLTLRINKLIYGYIQPQFGVLSAAVTLFFVCVAIFASTNVTSLIAPLGLGGLFILAILVIQGSVLKSIGQRISRAMDAYTETLSVTHGFLRNIHLEERQDEFLTKFSRNSRELYRGSASLIFFSALGRFAIEFVVVVWMVYGLLSALVQDDPSGITDIFVLMFAAVRAVPSVQQVINGISTIRGNSEIISELIPLLSANVEGKILMGPTINIPKGEFLTLSVNNLGVEVGGKKILEGVSLEVTKGDWVLIDGPSGAGKSTLLDTVMGLRPFQTGEVIFNSQKMDKGNVAEWRGMFCHVPQRIYIPAGFVGDYIKPVSNFPVESAFGRSIHELYDLLELADICPFNDVYQKVVTENGRNLSGGQRQRLSVLAALCKGRGLLILDESLSGIDLAQERRILSRLRLIKDLTLIAASHSGSIREHCGVSLNLLDFSCDYA